MVIDCELLGLFDSNSPSLCRGCERSVLYRKLFDVALEFWGNVKSICRPTITARNSSPNLRLWGWLHLEIATKAASAAAGLPLYMTSARDSRRNDFQRDVLVKLISSLA